MKRLGVLLLACALGSCAHFNSLPRRERTEVIVKTAIMAAIAGGFVTWAAIDGEQAFGVRL